MESIDQKFGTHIFHQFDIFCNHFGEKKTQFVAAGWKIRNPISSNLNLSNLEFGSIIIFLHVGKRGAYAEKSFVKNGSALHLDLILMTKNVKIMKMCINDDGMYSSKTIFGHNSLTVAKKFP